MAPPAVAPYPWDSLPSVPRGSLRLVGETRRRAGPIDADTVARAVEELLAATCRVSALRVTVEPPPAVRYAALTRADGLTLVASGETALVATVLSRLLSRPAPLIDPEAPMDPALAGAFSACVLEALRRAAPGAPAWRLARGSLPESERIGVRIDATVTLDERAYSASIWIGLSASPTAAPLDSPRGAGPGARSVLERLGDLPITMPLVAAQVELPGRDLRRARPGDGVLLADAWTLSRPPGATRSDDGACRSGRLLLAGPLSDRGLWVERCDDGTIVLTDQTVTVPNDATRSGTGRERSTGERTQVIADSDAAADSDAIADGVLDAPVVVRVEVAEVTLTARQWAELSPGDVLETQQRVADPVVLRVAGREVARGELVTVDGEVGVRIREITSEEGP